MHMNLGDDGDAILVDKSLEQRRVADEDSQTDENTQQVLHRS